MSKLMSRINLLSMSVGHILQKIVESANFRKKPDDQYLMISDQPKEGLTTLKMNVQTVRIIVISILNAFEP